MNGYEEYPDVIGSDIDICVHNVEEFERILLGLCKELDYKLVQKLNHHYGCVNFFIIKYFDNTPEILSLDVYRHYIYKSQVLFDSEWFLEKKIKFKNFYIPDAENEFIYYLVKKVIKQDIDTSILHLSQKFSLLKNNIDITSFFPNKSQKIYNAFLSNNKEFFANNKKELLSDLNSTVGFNYINKIREVSRIIRRVFHPTGIMISILGPDGCGKSTIIDAVKELDLPFRRIDYFHLKPTLIRPKGDGKPVENPHSKPAYKGFLSYLKLFHFMTEYLSGFFIEILPLKIKSSLIIFDRYYNDVYIDPKRFRYGGSKGFAKLMKFFIPKPDITFVLTTSAKIIIERKQEVPFEELTRQISEYKKIEGKDIVHIDVNDSIESITLQVQKSIFEKLSERY
jgi:thymidylate kinase